MPIFKNHTSLQRAPITGMAAALWPCYIRFNCTFDQQPRHRAQGIYFFIL
jgi:hypothetical protein